MTLHSKIINVQGTTQGIPDEPTLYLQKKFIMKKLFRFGYTVPDSIKRKCSGLKVRL